MKSERRKHEGGGEVSPWQSSLFSSIKIKEAKQKKKKGKKRYFSDGARPHETKKKRRRNEKKKYV